jgi:RNA polymerase sigma factor (sigma-70 family)
MSLLSDEELMMQLQLGDFSAIEIIYQRHSERVWHYIKKRVPKDICEDLFQESFVKLIEKRQVWKGQPFILWFYILIRNLIIDYYRSKKIAEKHLSSLVLTEEDLIKKEELEELLEKIPSNNAVILKEYFTEGWSYKELSLKYQLTETSLRKKISRIIANLKKGARDE